MPLSNDALQFPWWCLFSRMVSVYALWPQGQSFQSRPAYVGCKRDAKVYRNTRLDDQTFYGIPSNAYSKWMLSVHFQLAWTTFSRPHVKVLYASPNLQLSTYSFQCGTRLWKRKVIFLGGEWILRKCFPPASLLMDVDNNPALYLDSRFFFLKFFFLFPFF